MTHAWKVVPLSSGQLRDVRPEDILEDGLYRRCDTYRGGGGYDQFPSIAARRLGYHPDLLHRQFVVQLRGCNLDCPYCYVTRAGVWGEPVHRTTRELVGAFVRSGQDVFHLMGGAPAIQMKHWPELLHELRHQRPYTVFHSDMMLSEGPYHRDVLDELAGYNDNAIYAINVKGTTSEQWFANTRKGVDWVLFWDNWLRVQEAGVNAYVTFTGCRPFDIQVFWNRALQGGIERRWRDDSFIIDLIDYNASPHVDDVPWGR